MQLSQRRWLAKQALRFHAMKRGRVRVPRTRNRRARRVNRALSGECDCVSLVVLSDFRAGESLRPGGAGSNGEHKKARRFLPSAAPTIPTGGKGYSTRKL